MSNPRMLMAVLGVAALRIIVLLVSLIRGCTSRSDQPVSSLPAASVDAGSASSASSTKKKVDAADSDSKGSDTDSSGDNASPDASSDAADDDKTGSASASSSKRSSRFLLQRGRPLGLRSRSTAFLNMPILPLVPTRRNTPLLSRLKLPSITRAMSRLPKMAIRSVGTARLPVLAA